MHRPLSLPQQISIYGYGRISSGKKLAAFQQVISFTKIHPFSGNPWLQYPKANSYLEQFVALSGIMPLTD